MLPWVKDQVIIMFSSTGQKNLEIIFFNPLNVELNIICHLLTLLGAHHILHVSRIRVTELNLKLYSLIKVTIKQWLHRGAGKSSARPGRKQANVSVRMAWISFGPLPCRKKKPWCCWNHACPWNASELVSFPVGLRTLQHPGTYKSINQNSSFTAATITISSYLTVINHDYMCRLKFELIKSIPGIHISKYIEYKALKCTVFLTVFRVKCSNTFVHKYKYSNKLKELYNV